MTDRKPVELMDDRELLELAAKAAGIEWEGVLRDGGVFVLNGREWNPLMNDGDALRLAVKLNISINRPVRGDNEQHFGTYADDFNQKISVKMNDKGDPYAATRYAVVSVAAQIGKAMQ